MEATRSSETSVHNKPTLRHIPEGGILHSHLLLLSRVEHAQGVPELPSSATRLHFTVQVFAIPQVATGSGRGDNYTAMLYRVLVRGATQAGVPWKRSLIYKCLPDNPTRRQAFKSDALFRNEVAFYTQALPALLNFQVGAAACAESL
jgi:hypothetical protein